MSSPYAEKRARTTDKPSPLQMEAVVQTLTQPDVAEELVRRVSPDSGPENATFRAALREAGLVIMSRDTFLTIDSKWARCLESATRGDDYKGARTKLGVAYASVGEVPNGGVDRRAFENDVAADWGYYSNRDRQDDRLRARSANNCLNRDANNRVFYEGSVKAIEVGAKKAKELYNRTEAQVQPMPEVYLLLIDWAEGPKGSDDESEGE